MRRSKDDIFVQPKYSTNHDLGDTFMQLADLFRLRSRNWRGSPSERGGIDKDDEFGFSFSSC